MSGNADGAILGASIRTMDPGAPIASAIAWRDGTIVAVGDDAAVRSTVGPGTVVLDGSGAHVTPGLVDAHIHPFHGTIATRGVDLREATTLEEVNALLARERARCGPDAWVLGHSVRYEPFHASGITADAIAAAVGDVPAVLGFYDGHTSLASRPALALAGIDGPRAFAEFAEIVCDADGRPTGALLENGAQDLVRAVTPALTRDEALDAYAETLRAFNRVGLTGAHAMLGDPDLLDVVRALEARGDLGVRLLMPMHQPPGITDEEVAWHLGAVGERGRRWRAGTAKFFLDGVLDSGTAWLVDPGPGGLNADPFWPSLARYEELVARFTAAGFSCITHAVGDGAVRGALDAYERAGAPTRGRMHRIEHLETVMDEDLPRFASLNVAASMQPLHMEGLDDPSTPSSWSDGLSAGRLERGFRAADLAAAGALIPLGSDWMVADFDPRVGMAWARLRRKPGRRDLVPYRPEQALSAEQTLLGYTVWAAAVEGPEAGYGRLAVGMAADVSVFGADLVAYDADELPDVPVLATIVDGEVVHRSAEVRS
ncbi:MAG TPA: amidohydrolase [Baekduia sp.]|uniref:amidohydrolase n=1 Tax=Baekduia sp. TaxID=2600305 RepID=UPI002D76FF2F|nr:amidohydrolase [Baekduia sp.]HET6510262.1 amidohydrolase [Baekduia sp.]